MSKAMFEIGDIVRVTDDKEKLSRDALGNAKMIKFAGKEAQIVGCYTFNHNRYCYQARFFTEDKRVRNRSWFLTEESLCPIEECCDAEDGLDWASEADVLRLIDL